MPIEKKNARKCVDISHLFRARRPCRGVAERRPVTSLLDRVAIKKTWNGTKPKGNKNRMSEAEKFSAAVWQVAQAGGHAISLNLGIRREAMLTDHNDPRRRLMQNLNKHLRDAGFKDLPYQFVLELNPESEGGRLHLHGVIDTSGLTPDDLPRLCHALCRAASVAIDGERQIKMTPLDGRTTCWNTRARRGVPFAVAVLLLPWIKLRFCIWTGRLPTWNYTQPDGNWWAE